MQQSRMLGENAKRKNSSQTIDINRSGCGAMPRCVRQIKKRTFGKNQQNPDNKKIIEGVESV